MRDFTQKKRGSERVVSYYTERILSGELMAGMKLPSEQDLCSKFGVSRTVIREAIQQLKARGAVDTINGKGSYIAESRMDHFQDSLLLYSSRAGGFRDWSELLLMRSLIEVECVKGLTAEGDPVKLEKVYKSLLLMRENKDDIERFAEADIEFHSIMVNAYGNRLFIAVWESLKAMSLRFAHETYRNECQLVKNLAEHEAIYSAMVANDVDTAERTIIDHLADSRKNLEMMLGQK